MGQINGTAAPLTVGDWPTTWYQFAQPYTPVEVIAADFAEYEWGFMEQIIDKKDKLPRCFLTVEIVG